MRLKASNGHIGNDTLGEAERSGVAVRNADANILTDGKPPTPERNTHKDNEQETKELKASKNAIKTIAGILAEPDAHGSNLHMEVAGNEGMEDEEELNNMDEKDIEMDDDSNGEFEKKVEVDSSLDEGDLPTIEVPETEFGEEETAEFDDEDDALVEEDNEGDEDFPVFFEEGGEVELPPVEEEETAATEDLESPEAFEEPNADDVTLADADDMDDEVEPEMVEVGANVHAIVSNRIVATLTKRSAAKIGVADLYNTPQYLEVVKSNVSTDGLRKGLVKSGFVLAKVSIADKAIKANVTKRVESSVQQYLKSNQRKDAALEQSLAIAAVGINKGVFKDVKNSLKDSLVAQLEAVGVKGAARLVANVFATEGITYTKALLEKAKVVASWNDQVRLGYVQAFDMTNTPTVPSGEEEEDDDSLEVGQTPAVAALLAPMKNSNVVTAKALQSTSVLASLKANSLSVF